MRNQNAPKTATEYLLFWNETKYHRNMMRLNRAAKSYV